MDFLEPCLLARENMIANQSNKRIDARKHRIWVVMVLDIL